MTYLLHTNAIFLTDQKISENPSANINALCNSCATISYCSVESNFTFLYAGNRIQNAREQFAFRIHIYFQNFPLHPTQPNKNPAELSLEIQTIVSR